MTYESQSSEPVCFMSLLRPAAEALQKLLAVARPSALRLPLRCLAGHANQPAAAREHGVTFPPRWQANVSRRWTRVWCAGGLDRSPVHLAPK